MNGQIVSAEEARVSPFDRGFIFGDGIYEGLRSVVVDGQRRVVGMQRHARRMAAGLQRIGIAWDTGVLARLTDELLDANGLADAFIYWQVTRGVPALDGTQAVRSRVPVGGMRPTVFGYCSPVPALEAFVEPPAKRTCTQEDIRWKLATVKSISLLGNVLCSMGAATDGSDEAILVRERLVTEGAYTNVAIVVDRGAGRGVEVATPAAEGGAFLLGVTRQIILERVPARTGISITERAVRAEELATAREVLLWGTTTMVSSVVRLDGRAVGDGRPGPVGKKLLAGLVEVIREGEDDV